jgi:hypothetical protein
MSAPESITVRETIHHGDYRNVREQTIRPTWDGLVALLDASPYNAKGHRADYAKNRYVAIMFADLLTKGRGEHGWARYEVIA